MTPRRPRGRPRKKPEDLRTCTVLVKFTDAEAAALDRLALEMRRPLAVMVRESALHVLLNRAGARFSAQHYYSSRSN